MAFTSAITGKTVFGNKRVHFGTWTTDTTTGDIDTGLRSCEAFFMQINATSIVADAPTVNETFPVAGSAVTIIVTSGADGYWLAVGY